MEMLNFITKLELLQKYHLVSGWLELRTISHITNNCCLEDNLVREEKTKVLNKRRDAMQELRGAGGQPARTLKKQTTNDRSRPTVSGVLDSILQCSDI